MLRRLSVVLGLFLIPGWAQETSEISGRMVDASGAVVSGASSNTPIWAAAGLDHFQCADAIDDRIDGFWQNCSDQPPGSQPAGLAQNHVLIRRSG